MNLQSLFYLATLLVSVNAGNYEPGDNYSTFTPSEGIISGAVTEFTQTFGIAVKPIISSVVLSSVTTESDGEVLVTQIGDGQIQEATSASALVVTQIGDGQIQATTSTFTPEVQIVSQISDGQIQATTLTTITRSLTISSSVATTGLTQKNDDQIQPATTISKSTNTDVVTTHVTKIIKEYVTVAYSESSIIISSSSFSDEEDVTTYYTVTPTTTVFATITSANLPTLPATTVIVNKRDEQYTGLYQKRDLASTCFTNSSLAMTLENSILFDSRGRIGSIVANDQFQFDGPTPQSGAVYTAGWSIYDGKLALGQSTTFYQCLSGNFYNLYDISIGSQCIAVELEIVLLEKC